MRNSINGEILVHYTCCRVRGGLDRAEVIMRNLIRVCRLTGHEKIETRLARFSRLRSQWEPMARPYRLGGFKPHMFHWA